MMDTHHRPKKQKARCDSSTAGQHERFLQLTWTNSKAKPMIARIGVCHNHATVLDTPNAKRIKHPTKSGVFSRPNSKDCSILSRSTDAGITVSAWFWGREGLSVRTPARLCTCVYPRPHQLRLDTALVASSSVRKGTEAMQLATTQRPSAHPTPSAYTPTAQAGDFNRDVIAVGNAENAIARVLFELRKPCPDNARALKLALAALAAVQYVGLGVQ